MTVLVRHQRILLALSLGATLIGPWAGCSRERYFRQADQDAKCLVAEKSNDPRWCAPPNFNVTMDPRSRYYDNCNEVRPPMPKDDPASHVYMECVDGMKGWPHWLRNGVRPGLENPDWRKRLSEYVPVTKDGAVKLSVDSALDLARVNSPEFQNQLETIYLSALDVSTERFRFETQFFGGDGLSFTHLGRLRTGVERNLLENDIDARMKRRLATAGELLVGFANATVWQFAGPDTFSTTSLVNFSLVQPLLRGAGRDVALEQLTLAERTLLANLRAFQRYRQGFYVRVAVGDANVAGPQRRGGFFGGTGLTGFTGTGSGGFGGVGDVTGFGRAGFGTGGTGASGGGGAGFAGGGAGTVGGFVGLLQQLQQIRNTEENLALQLRTLGLLEAHLDAGTIDLTQVDQFRQNIETERATLLQSQNALEDTLDSYKTATLGMPADLPIVLDDAMIRRFQFIDQGMSRLQNGLSDFLTEFGNQPAAPSLEAVGNALDRMAALRDQGAAQFGVVAADLRAAREAAPARLEGMSVADRRRLESDMARLDAGFAALQGRIEQTGPRLAELRSRLTDANRQATSDKLVQLVTEISGIVDELSLVQARARLEQVTIHPQSLDWRDAVDIARANRLDWMNNRAALVDTWRLIQFNADALQSNLDLTFSGDMGTVGDNPVKFRAPTGSLRVGVRFDGPFTRLLERNNFRQVIINYEQNRRQLIQFEDGVEQTLRQLIRDLEQLEINLEIQRRAVVIAIRRVDQTRDVLNEPPQPPQPGQPTTQLGPTAALNLLTALSDLRSSQNNFMSVWLNYYAARMRLARELGTMELDDRGIWIEQPLVAAERLKAEEAPLPPEFPEKWLEKLEPGLPKDQLPPDTAPPPIPAAPEPGLPIKNPFRPEVLPLPPPAKP